MRLADLAFLNVPAVPDGSPLRGTGRLVRDLLCVGLMVEERPPAAERVEARLGRELADIVHAAIVGPGPVHGLRSHRAA